MNCEQEEMRNEPGGIKCTSPLTLRKEQGGKVYLTVKTGQVTVVAAGDLQYI